MRWNFSVQSGSSLFLSGWSFYQILKLEVRFCQSTIANFLNAFLISSWVAFLVIPNSSYKLKLNDINLNKINLKKIFLILGSKLIKYYNLKYVTCLSSLLFS
jgi:hypothetical protein